MLKLAGKNSKRKTSSSIVGLEFQQSGVAVVVNHGKGRAFECLFRSSESDDDSHQLALSELVKKYRLAGMPAVVSMQSDEYSLFQLRSPAMKKEELRSSMKWRIKDLVDYSAEQAVVDVFEFPESGQRGTERLLYVAATQAPYVMRNVNIIRESGLKVNAIDIGELALRNTVSRLPEHDAGVVVLFLSRRSGLLVFVKGYELYLARRLEVGLDSYESASEEQKGLMSEQIFLEIQRSLDYYEGHFSSPLPGKLYIVPGINAISPLLEQIRGNLSLTVEGVLLESILKDHNHLDEQLQTHCVLAAGAAMRELEGAGI